MGINVVGMNTQDTFRLETLARLVGDATGCPDLFAHRRTAKLVAARAVFHYLAFIYLNATLTQIARFSGRSYSIIYYDVTRFKERLNYDWRLRDAWDLCKDIPEAIAQL